MPYELINLGVARKNLATYKNYILDGNEKKLIDDIKKNTSVPLFYNDSTLVRQIIHQSEFVGDKKYPSEKNLTTVFKRFGINEIFNEINRRGHKDYKILLKSFSDKRTSIAHEITSTDLTLSDVITNLNNINQLVDKLDRVLHKHVCKYSGTDCWTSSRSIDF